MYGKTSLGIPDNPKDAGIGHQHKRRALALTSSGSTVARCFAVASSCSGWWRAAVWYQGACVIVMTCPPFFRGDAAERRAALFFSRCSTPQRCFTAYVRLRRNPGKDWTEITTFAESHDNPIGLCGVDELQVCDFGSNHERCALPVHVRERALQPASLTFVGITDEK